MNALNYTQVEGSVSVNIDCEKETAEKNETKLLIEIADTGIGISEKDMSKVFDRFYQSDLSKGEPYEGTGLGLNIVKEYIELHEGTIFVNSLIINIIENGGRPL